METCINKPMKKSKCKTITINSKNKINIKLSEHDDLIYIYNYKTNNPI